MDVSPATVTAYTHTHLYMEHGHFIVFYDKVWHSTFLNVQIFFLPKIPRQNEIESIKIYKRMKVPVCEMHVCLCMSATVSVAIHK